MDPKKMSAKAWADAESALRARYDGLGLYVRKQVYEKPGTTIVVGGWAFLDGEPAMLPTDLDLLVVSTDGPGGAMETLGREPAAVLSILAPYATRTADPIDHWAVRVPDAEKAGLIARIRALPEHRGDAPPRPVAATMAMGNAMGGAMPMGSAMPMGGAMPMGSAMPMGAPPTVLAAEPSPRGNNMTWIVLALVGLFGVASLACVGFGIFAFTATRSSSAAAPVYAPPSYPPPSYPPPSYPPPSYPSYPPSYPPPSIGAPVPPPTRYSFPVPANAPSRGSFAAPIVIQVFSDFQCPFCERVEPTIARIRDAYPAQVRIVWHHYPLPFHNNAMPAAEAASEVFAEAGDAGFWPYHDMLFENRDALDEANLVALAGRLSGVDPSRVRAALADHRHRPAIEADMAAVRAAGMSLGTPSFLINDELVSGAQPFERFREVIEAHLAAGH